MKIEVYSDGSATVATKPGGYGWVLVIDGKKITEGNGYMEKASNNDAELEAAIQGLAMVLKMRIEGKIPIGAHEVYLVSDSQIVLGWVDGTYRFKQRNKRHKFEQLQHVVKKLNVKTRWVQGHSGDEHNERCDKLANLARKQLEKDDQKQEEREKGHKAKNIQKKDIMLKLGIEIHHDKLYNMCYEALRHANSGTHPKESNDWMSMFTDKLQEEMEKDDRFFAIRMKK